ncbi:MAG: UbiD family decarboxylase [Geminicoccaceae bacterium]
MTDLRSFLASVRTRLPREFLTVEQPVSPDYEIAAIVAKLEQRLRTPVLHFKHVDGSDLEVVTNVAASLPRIAKAADSTQKDLEQRLIDAYDRPLAPVICRSEAAPVRDVVERGEAVDLGKLPQCRYTTSETRPYITAATVVARDPESGIHNLSYHRLMLLDRRRTGIFMTPGGHLDRIFRKHAERGEATPIAAFIGSHPLWALGSLAHGSMDVDEYAVIGGLMGEAVEVVAGLDDERLLVPARAEIVLEGRILPDETADEGPFGEFSGYATVKEPAPVVAFDVMSRRDGAIYQDIVAGRTEHLTLSGAAIRAYLHRKLKQDFDVIGDLYLPAPFTLYLQLDKAAFPHLEVKGMLQAILRDLPFVKYAFAFDPDIDLKNARQTAWAIATRAQPDRDGVLLEGRPGIKLDPSEENGKTAKWAIDATAKPGLAAYPPINQIPKAVMDRVDVTPLLKPGTAGKGPGDV